MNPQLTTKDLIIKTASELFYHQGYEKTSFADFAQALGISRGNFYHHFKTKDDILEAVILYRLNEINHVLNQWNQSTHSAKDRIQLFIRMLLLNRTQLKLYGCPIGTLCSELAKLDHTSKTQAQKLFELYLHWLTIQFGFLGSKRKAEETALHLLGRCQGISVLAHAMNDEDIVLSEVKILEKWLHNL